jgi:hypothetical protein
MLTNQNRRKNQPDTKTSKQEMQLLDNIHAKVTPLNELLHFL